MSTPHPTQEIVDALYVGATQNGFEIRCTAASREGAVRLSAWLRSGIDQKETHHLVTLRETRGDSDYDHHNIITARDGDNIHALCHALAATFLGEPDDDAELTQPDDSGYYRFDDRTLRVVSIRPVSAVEANILKAVCCTHSGEDLAAYLEPLEEKPLARETTA